MIVPIHVCLPCLKTLRLEFIKFEDDDSVKRLLSSSPVLEDLSISVCFMQNIRSLKISHPSLKRMSIAFQRSPSSSDIVFDLPSLVYFKFEVNTAKIHIIVNMPSLVRADINFAIGSFGGEINYQLDVLDELFEGLVNVKSLRLEIVPELLPFLSHGRFVAFQNMLHLEVHNWMKKLDGFEFLEFSPNLQTFVMCTPPKQESFPMEKVPSCVAYQLKEWKVLHFDDESSLFKMVTYILNNATVHEKLTVCTYPVLKVETEFRITKQLLNLPRCSNKCRVVAF
ncbi:hypothetical protein V6N13_013196 [Hibiscus sabdariffa]|uniref:FBD domain-containing protein n=1 Tax=Hibiscus sabdariffa TaxID=183260 RepID=A0ABR2SHM7_9ROSI